MSFFIRSAFAAALLSTTASVIAQPPASEPMRPAPLATLARSVDLPYSSFTLPNGLRVVVSTDRKAPVVAVSVWYDVGSKHEPAGQTGFAHLFEHLMFNGSENAPGDLFGPLREMGATDANGTTYFDRTNYFETVPRAGLERALFLESDRMGHLLSAIDQGKLDAQRGVVQNEKRQGDNQPYGLTNYRVTEALYPAGHPYAHQPIGSMADLDRASLADVKGWFRDHYGPNNAVLALAGDIDLATAKRLVTKYFGAIPTGPKSIRPAVLVPTLAAPKNEAMTDRVPTTRIVRAWTIPGITDSDAPALTLAAGVLGGSLSSRLTTALVIDQRLATEAHTSYNALAQGGVLSITMDLRDGVDPATATQQLDAVLADFLAKGPTADEVTRVATRIVTGEIKALDSVGGFGGKAPVLAEGLLFTGDAGFYRKDLDRIAAVTPARARDAALRWLSRPAYTLTISPGPRGDYAEAADGADNGPALKTVVPPPAVPTAIGKRDPLPPIAGATATRFPDVVRTTLSNGIPVVYARRPTSPVTYVTVNFDAGDAADAQDRRGIQTLVADMLDKSVGSLDATGFAQARERLGLRVGAGGTEDETRLLMDVPSVNLTPALMLFADMARRPAFTEADLVRARDQRLAGIKSEFTSPFGLSKRMSNPLLFGADSPYGGSDDPAVIRSATRADLLAFQRSWLRPDKARIFVVTDQPLATVKADLERVFGDWRPEGSAGVKRFAPFTPTSPRIVLINLPGTPQALVTGYMPTALKGTDDILVANTANEALGGGFMGRINMDIREDKHWTYGASGRLRPAVHAAPYSITSSVQTNRVGAAIDAIRRDIKSFNSTAPMTQAEFDQIVAGATRALPGQFEGSSAVLSAMMANDRFRRPDDYYSTIAARYQAMTPPQLSTALGSLIDPSRMFWIVVGDAAKVRPQLDGLGLPVETVEASAVK